MIIMAFLPQNNIDKISKATIKLLERNNVIPDYEIISINWIGRKKGYSKFKIKELGSMYLFTLLYCWLERILLKKN